MDIRIERVSVSVPDIGGPIRARIEQVGFVLDHDHRVGDEIRWCRSVHFDTRTATVGPADRSSGPA